MGSPAGTATEAHTATDSRIFIVSTRSTPVTSAKQANITRLAGDTFKSCPPQSSGPKGTLLDDFPKANEMDIHRRAFGRLECQQDHVPEPVVPMRPSGPSAQAPFRRLRHLGFASCPVGGPLESSASTDEPTSNTSFGTQFLLMEPSEDSDEERDDVADGDEPLTAGDASEATWSAFRASCTGELHVPTRGSPTSGVRFNQLVDSTEDFSEEESRAQSSRSKFSSSMAAKGTFDLSRDVEVTLFSKGLNLFSDDSEKGHDLLPPLNLRTVPRGVAGVHASRFASEKPQAGPPLFDAGDSGVDRIWHSTADEGDALTGRWQRRHRLLNDDFHSAPANCTQAALSCRSRRQPEQQPPIKSAIAPRSLIMDSIACSDSEDD